MIFFFVSISYRTANSNKLNNKQFFSLMCRRMIDERPFIVDEKAEEIALAS